MFYKDMRRLELYTLMYFLKNTNFTKFQLQVASVLNAEIELFKNGFLVNMYRGCFRI